MKKFFIRVRNAQQLKTVMKSGCKIVNDNNVLLVPLNLASQADQVRGMRVFIDLPFISRENRMEEVESALDMAAAADNQAEGMVIKNIDELGMLKAKNYSGQVIGDSFLYSYNKEAADFYREVLPNMMFMAPDELTDEEIKKMPVSAELIYKIYGRQRVMLSAQSLHENYEGAETVKSSFPDGEKNGSGSGEPRMLLESMKKDRYMSVDEAFGYTALYTREPVSMLDRAEGVEWQNIMVDFTTETGKECLAVLEILDRIAADEVPVETGAIGAVGRGHHYKGID